MQHKSLTPSRHHTYVHSMYTTVLPASLYFRSTLLFSARLLTSKPAASTIARAISFASATSWSPIANLGQRSQQEYKDRKCAQYEICTVPSARSVRRRTRTTYSE